MARAVFYGRFSSNNQREESIDAQLRAVEDFARKNDHELVGNYADKAKSGTNSSKRSEFLRMIRDAEKGLFEVVIVHKLDRFSRDKYDSALYKRKLKQCGVRLISVTEQLDDSPESVILESVIEGMAEYYSKNLARETLKGLKENGYKALHNGGKPPLGYDVNSEKKYIINEREAESVRLIFDMYIAGYSQSEMVNELNERGFKTKLGTIFKSNSIHSILTNEKYTGVYVYNKSAKKVCNQILNTSIINHKEGTKNVFEKVEFYRDKKYSNAWDYTNITKDKNETEEEYQKRIELLKKNYIVYSYGIINFDTYMREKENTKLGKLVKQVDAKGMNDLMISWIAKKEGK